MLNIATIDTTNSSGRNAAENAAQAEIVCAVLRDGCSYLDDLGRFLFTTSSLFRVGNSLEANSSLAELVSGLGLLVQAIDAVGASLQGSQGLETLANNLNAVLREILHAQERKDLVLLADLLEYELAPHLESWKSIFTALLTDLS